jgi:hypothetical protein
MMPKDVLHPMAQLIPLSLVLWNYNDLVQFLAIRRDILRNCDRLRINIGSTLFFDYFIKQSLVRRRSIP